MCHRQKQSIVFFPSPHIPIRLHQSIDSLMSDWIPSEIGGESWRGGEKREAQFSQWLKRTQIALITSRTLWRGPEGQCVEQIEVGACVLWNEDDTSPRGTETLHKFLSYAGGAVHCYYREQVFLSEVQCRVWSLPYWRRIMLAFYYESISTQFL